MEEYPSEHHLYEQGVKAYHQRKAEEELKAVRRASMGEQKDTCYCPSLQERLEKVFSAATERTAESRTALAILGRHPEFVEFIELQRILNRIEY